MNRAVQRFFFSSLSLWLLVAVFGVYFIANLQRYVSFGIDLVGGTYLTLEVQLDSAIEAETMDRFGHFLKGVTEQTSAPQSQTFSGQTLKVTFATEEEARLVEQKLAASPVRLRASRNGAVLTCTLPPEDIVKIGHDAVEGNIHVLRSRIDQFGVGEVTIAAQGDKKIVVELPHVQDVRKAKGIIGTSALLEIKPVIDVGDSEEAVLKKTGGKLPDGLMVVSDRDSKRGFYLVPRRADLTGRLLKTAWANPAGGKFGIEPVVNFQFTAEGGDKFYALTSRGNSPLIAILIDNVVVTAARAEQPLRSEGYISGNFTLEHAKELASLLKSGAFVAPVIFVEDRTIGPSLGAESIHGGLMACMIGILLLLIFNILVYRFAGLFAFVVLLFNLLLILFAMALLGATLTLPGIAGMVLTLGMAVDASVLIYERIREELEKKVQFSAAVSAGFAGALTVILDANITTFLAALVLYKMGSGPIQGFAVTMMVGIVSTLITGLILLKSIFSYVIDGLGVRKLSI